MSNGESWKEVWGEESSSNDTKSQLPTVILNVVLYVDEYLLVPISILFRVLA